jgi:hypothetical protein
MNDPIEARNKSASFYVYGDLCEIQNYINVKANFIQELDIIYLEGDFKNKHEFILPIDESDSELNIIQLVYSAILDINAKNENKLIIKK